MLDTHVASPMLAAETKGHFQQSNVYWMRLKIRWSLGRTAFTRNKILEGRL